MESNPTENQLVEDNTGFVISIAKSFNPANITELDEYIQSGRIGLLKAIRLYDPSLGYQLCSLAKTYIVWEILTYIKSQKKHVHNISLELDPSYSVIDKFWEYVPDTLTENERTVIQMKCEGLTYKEIGRRCGNYSRGWANRLYTSAIRKISKANA